MKQEMTGWQWHQLDRMQIIYTSLQVDRPNHDTTESLSFFMCRVLFLPHNHQCQSTEGKNTICQLKQSISLLLLAVELSIYTEHSVGRSVGLSVGRCVCLSTRVYCGKTVELIWMPFG